MNKTGTCTVNMSFANEKGGYIKSLEVTRENSNRSYCTLSTNFLEKTENYILNVTDFVTNTSPPMNLIEGPYLTLLPLGDQGQTPIQAAGVAGAPAVVSFTPTVYRSWLELGRQLDVFFKQQATLAGDETYAKFYLNPDGKMNLHLSNDFLSHRYIQVSEEVMGILDCTQYIFLVHNTLAERLARDNHTHLEVGYELFAQNGTFNHNYAQIGTVEQFNFETPRPLSNFEQRESVDVYCTFPMKSRISAFNGKEEHEHILFTLPYNEQHELKTEVSFVRQGMQNDIANIAEDLDIGLTNLCSKHTSTLQQTLLSGVIRNIQLRIAVRYVNASGVTEQDFDFTNGGFWYLRLLFVKKV